MSSADGKSMEIVVKNEPQGVDSDDKDLILKMSSADGKSMEIVVKNEPQGVDSDDEDLILKMSSADGKSMEIVVKKEPQDVDSDDEDLSYADNFESLEEEDISNDPELTNEIKKKLIYEDSPFSEDHIFWVNSRQDIVRSAKKEIRILKKEIKQGTKRGAHNWGLLEQLEEKERLFVKTYMKKIKFTENSPVLHAIHLWWWTEPQMNLMYKKKDHTCPARSKLEAFIKQLSKDIKFLKRKRNKYFSNMRMELLLKKRQCFEEFYVLNKTPRELGFTKNHVKDIPVPFKPHIVIESPPWTDELSHDDKQRLIYAKQNFTKDHIFWTDTRGEEVNKHRDVMKITKEFLQRMIKAENQIQIANAKEAIERQELYFISKYIHKVEIDHSLPLIHPMPQDLQKIIYANDNNIDQFPFIIKICTEQKEMLVKLKDLKHKISLMEKYKNMYAPHVLNQLHHLEFEYKKKFLIAKNPDKIFPEYDMKLKIVNDASTDASDNNKINLPSQVSGEKDDSHLENDTKNSPMASEDDDMNSGDENKDNDDEGGMNCNRTSNNWSRWINELPSNVKEQLIYSKESNSDDHIFWVHTPDHSVIWAKKELAQMKEYFQKALQSGDANQIDILKKEIEDKEELFVKNHFNKVEYNKTLPMIEPMEPRLRKALYSIKSSKVTYNIKRCPEQIEMLLDLKARKRIFTRMERVKNIHVPSVVNELYHKEFEYQKQFLTMKELSKRKMKKIAFKLAKANASFGNKNKTHVQNPNTLNEYKQSSQTFAQRNTNWKQNQPERQPTNVNQFQQSNNDGNGQMNVQMWGQQQMQSINNKDSSQYYGYNQSNCSSQLSWGQPNSNWNQAPTPGNQGGDFNQSWNNRGNQPQYNNSSYNQNTFERNNSFKDNSRHTKPKSHGYHPY